MSVECFFDTNVLVYAASSAEEDRSKKALALDLIRSASFGISAQVLQEFYVTITRKIRKPISPEVAVALLEAYRVFPMVPLDYPLVISAVELSLRHRISYWDAAIVAAAHCLEAAILYSEDLAHGQLYGSVRVFNPFLESS